MVQQDYGAARQSKNAHPCRPPQFFRREKPDIHGKGRLVRQFDKLVIPSCHGRRDHSRAQAMPQGSEHHQWGGKERRGRGAARIPPHPVLRTGCTRVAWIIEPGKRRQRRSAQRAVDESVKVQPLKQFSIEVVLRRVGQSQCHLRLATGKAFDIHIRGNAQFHTGMAASEICEARHVSERQQVHGRQVEPPGQMRVVAGNAAFKRRHFLFDPIRRFHRTLSRLTQAKPVAGSFQQICPKMPLKLPHLAGNRRMRKTKPFARLAECRRSPEGRKYGQIMLGHYIVQFCSR